MSGVRRYEFHGEDERVMQFGMEYVAGDDYDALAAELAAVKEHSVTLWADWCRDRERMRQLEAALRQINTLACYASEENTDAREAALLEIGKLARANLAPKEPT